MNDTEYVAELIRKANELVADLKIDKSQVVEVARLLHEVRKRKEISSPYKSGKSDPVAEARKAPRKPMIVRPVSKAPVKVEVVAKDIVPGVEPLTKPLTKAKPRKR